jgi:hypothetical protein
MWEFERQGGDVAANVDPQAKWPDIVAHELRELIVLCTNSDSSERPSMTDVSVDPSLSCTVMSYSYFSHYTGSWTIDGDCV